LKLGLLAEKSDKIGQLVLPVKDAHTFPAGLADWHPEITRVTLNQPVGICGYFKQSTSYLIPSIVLY